MAAPGSELLMNGAYTVTWNAVALGMHEGEAGVPSILFQDHSDPVNKTDTYGRAKIESIRMGIDYQYEGVLMEYSRWLAVLTNYLVTFGTQGSVGAFKTILAKPLVMTAVIPSGAPATLTASKAVLADEFNGRLMYGPQLRTCPLRLDLLPYMIVSTVGNFTMT